MLLIKNSYALNINNINKVQVLDSSFINNIANETGIIIRLYLLLSHYEISYFTLSNCTFVMKSNFVILNTLSNIALLDVLIENNLQPFGTAGRLTVSRIYIVLLR